MWTHSIMHKAMGLQFQPINAVLQPKLRRAPQLQARVEAQDRASQLWQAARVLVQPLERSREAAKAQRLGQLRAAPRVSFTTA